jgi:peptidoglycan/LPS O-acetylase OafA/YrhL
MYLIDWDRRRRVVRAGTGTADPMMSSRGRNQSLDGLRGVAAMSVALGHCFMIIGGQTLWESNIRQFGLMSWTDIGLRLVSVLFPAEAAVMVFFVLSGHVLWTSFQRKDLRFFTDLPDYISARVFRLFPLAIMSALPFGLLMQASASDLVMNMLLLRRDLNGVLWSLQVEVVASMVLFAVWGLTRGTAWKLVLVLITTVVAVPFFRGNPYVVFMPAFILGALLSSIPARVWLNSWILGVGVAILVMPTLVFAFGGVSRCFEIVGSTVLVGAVASGRFQFLRSHFPLFLGAISYPCYLTHPIGLTLGMLWVQSLPTESPFVRVFVLAVISLSMTIPFAWVLHVCVEDPVLRARPRFSWRG